MEVSVLQAKTDLSRLLHLLETKQEDSITISRYGRPVYVMSPGQFRKELSGQSRQNMNSVFDVIL